MASRVHVCIRVRPLTQKEQEDKSNVVVEVTSPSTIKIKNPEFVTGHMKDHLVLEEHFSRVFTFDRVFVQLSLNTNEISIGSQEDVHSVVGNFALQHANDGHNCTIFAYGQTGAGKSYTILGPGSAIQRETVSESELGLLPRFIQDALTCFPPKKVIKKVSHAHKVGLSDLPELDLIVECKIQASYMEIYNERVRDLLCTSNQSSNDKTETKWLRVREHPKNGPYVEGLSRHPIQTESDSWNLLSLGTESRAVATTAMNANSSRSHAIFMIYIQQSQQLSQIETSCGKGTTCLEKMDAKEENLSIPSRIENTVCFVDLAGSERANVSDVDRLRETSNINRSLTALGSVINALAELNSLQSQTESRPRFGSNSRPMLGTRTKSSENLTRPRRNSQPIHIPYRDSVLTWLLRSSLGGSAATFMIGNISPSESSYEETLSTLRYVDRAKKIQCLPVVQRQDSRDLVSELKEEVHVLRTSLRHIQNELASANETINYYRTTQDNSIGSIDVYDSDPGSLKTEFDATLQPHVYTTPPSDPCSAFFSSNAHDSVQKRDFNITQDENVILNDPICVLDCLSLEVEQSPKDCESPSLQTSHNSQDSQDSQDPLACHIQVESTETLNATDSHDQYANLNGRDPANQDQNGLEFANRELVLSEETQSVCKSDDKYIQVMRELDAIKLMYQMLLEPIDWTTPNISEG